MQFEFRNKQPNKSVYHDSKRFMYGALVCFTMDNFKTLIFGQVIESSVISGKVVVNLNENAGVDYDVDYIMVECNTYFEPYYQVLKVLQGMNVIYFPFEKYVIQVDPEVRPPRYLRDGPRYNIDGYSVRVCDLQHWPNADRLRLNNTQYKAFQAALNNEFAIIQGPPGTGKTHLGLKIVKTLLGYKRYWQLDAPILIVSFTNHALDHFVEGLIDSTESIIRIGGQSKSEVMNKFRLHEMRRLMNKKLDRHTNRHMKFLRELAKDIEQSNAQLDSFSQFNVVTDFNCFRKVDAAFNQSWFASASKSDIILWLTGGRNYNEQKEDTEQSTIKEVNTYSQNYCKKNFRM